MSTLDAVLVDGQLVSATDHTDVYLRPTQVAERLRVAPETVSRWAGVPVASPADTPPYPAHVPGQHTVVGGVVYVLASALDAWAAAVESVHGRRSAVGRRGRVAGPDGMVVSGRFERAGGGA